MIKINNNYKFKKSYKILHLSFYLLFAFLFSLCIFTTKYVNATNIDDYVILGGESIGLNIKTDVYVTGKYSIDTIDGKHTPWKNSDIEVNDIIYSINNTIINSIEDLKNVNVFGKTEIVLIRNNKKIITELDVKESLNKDYPLGLYVKDNILGVGTMTYYDKKTGKFASLGHNAVDGSISKGYITKSYVNGIIKGMRGNPGSKRAYLDSEQIGEITTNNEFGVFGTLSKNILTSDLIKVGSSNNVHKGQATITTVLSSDIKETFTIEIIDVKKQSLPDIKGIKFKVTDEDLIERTGGIIQGMSGSPIVQDGLLIGAVSHVLVEDSSLGYGVFVEFMNDFT